MGTDPPTIPLPHPPERGRRGRWRSVIGLIGAVVVVAGQTVESGLPVTVVGTSLLLAAALTPIRRRRDGSVALPRRPAMVEAFLASNAGSWSWRLDDGSIRVDPIFERLAGLRPDEIGDRFENLLARLHPDDLAPIHAALDAVADAPGRTFDVRVRFRDGADRWRPLRLVGGEVTTEDGRASVSGIAVDDLGDAVAQDLATRTSDELVRALSDLSQANADLERVRIDLERRNGELDAARRAAIDATRSKSEFLANMSHEIRTPLTAIIGYAELIAEGGRGAAECTEMAGTIRRNGEHLLSLIGDVLDLSKIEAGRMEIERIPTDPLACVRDALTLLETEAARRGLDLRLETTDRMPATVSIDPTRLRQVVLNLVGNALKFTTEGGVVVHMDHHAASNRLEVAVVDTGIGLDERTRGRIFEPFRQADGSTTRRFGGTGLGLSISRTLCELLGGDLTVTSTPGRGSAFTAAFLAPPTAVIRRQASESSVPSGLRVLLAEDGPDNRRLVEHLLSKLGATVESVENGAEAVDRVLTGGPLDLLLLDMQMPVMDGWEAARRIRNAGCDLPIVALTANALPGDRTACLEAGCDAYLAKPIRRDALAAIIAEALGTATMRVDRRRAG